MTLSGNTLAEAAANLARLKSWQPFRFSGQWFLVATPEGVEAFRTKKAAVKCCQKFNLNSYSVAQ